MSAASPRDPRFVASGTDRFDEARSMGISTLRFKVASEDSAGAFFLVEQTMHAPGGPPRHLHPSQDVLSLVPARTAQPSAPPR